MVIGLLGILKAGGAYLPLDPDYPAERLADMLTDAGLRVVLTQGALARRCRCRRRAPHPARPAIELTASPLSADAAAPPLDDLHPGHLAYVIYTSGSTGKPKGAANTHEGLHNRLAWMQDAYGLDGRRRGAAEDAVQLRRLGLGVLLAADGGRAAGGGGAGRAPRSGAAGRDDRTRMA